MTRWSGGLNSVKKDSSVFSKTSRRVFGDHQVSSSKRNVVLSRRQIGQCAKLTTLLDPGLRIRLNGDMCLYSSYMSSICGQGNFHFYLSRSYLFYKKADTSSSFKNRKILKKKECLESFECLLPQRRISYNDVLSLINSTIL